MTENSEELTSNVLDRFSKKGVKYIYDFENREMYIQDSEGNKFIIPNYKIQVDFGTYSVSAQNWGKYKGERKRRAKDIKLNGKR